MENQVGLPGAPKEVRLTQEIGDTRIGAKLKESVATIPQEDVSLLIAQKKNKKGTTTYGLTDLGKQKARKILEETIDDTVSNYTGVQQAVRGIRQELQLPEQQKARKTLETEAKKVIRNALVQEYKAAGKKIVGNETFKRELQKRIQQDPQLQAIHLQFKLLDSIAMTAKNNAVLERKNEISKTITEEDIQLYRIKLQQKRNETIAAGEKPRRIPNRALIVNAIIAERLKEQPAQLPEIDTQVSVEERRKTISPEENRRRKSGLLGARLKTVEETSEEVRIANEQTALLTARAGIASERIEERGRGVAKGWGLSTTEAIQHAASRLFGSARFRNVTLAAMAFTTGTGAVVLPNAQQIAREFSRVGGVTATEMVAQVPDTIQLEAVKTMQKSSQQETQVSQEKIQEPSEMAPLSLDVATKESVRQEVQAAVNKASLIEIAPYTEQEKKVQALIGEAVKQYTFSFSFNDEVITSNIPYGELNDYYPNFPRSTSIGAIPSKLTPQEANTIFENAKQSGQLEKLFIKNFVKYGQNMSEDEIRKLPSSEQVFYEIPDVKQRALYVSLIDLGVFLDCNGTVTNILKNVHDAQKGEGEYDKLLKNIYPDLANKKNPAGWFDIGRFENPEFADNLGKLAAKDYKPGDSIQPIRYVD